MNAIDFILNIAALLLWFSWRSVHFDPLAASTPTTLVGTLKRTEQPHMKGWKFLAGLISILLLRGLLYWQVGSAAGWTPKLNLLVVVLVFRIDIFGVALLFSLLSFLELLAVVYFWLVILAMLNYRTEQGDPLLRLVRLQLGPVARWHWSIQLLFPLFIIASLWMASVVAQVQSLTRLTEQGLLIGAVLYLTLKYLLPAILLAQLVLTYVYLGKSPLWEFIATTAGRVLAPIRRLPLRVGKLDLSPLVAAVLILLGLEVLPNYVLRKLFELKRSTWPQ
jgi:uncharacterized protein YggT (Ycf19 family)